MDYEPTGGGYVPLREVNWLCQDSIARGIYVRSTTTNAGVVNTWKEIAEYLGRGIRTVQRWEQELGLPVRRPRGKYRSAVIAMKSELDKWMRSSPMDLRRGQTKPPVLQLPLTFLDNFAVMREKRRQLIASSSIVHQKAIDLRANFRRTTTLTRKLIELREMQSASSNNGVDARM